MSLYPADRQAEVSARQRSEACVAALHQAQHQVTLEPLAASLTSVARWRRFMRLHVFAVWDFMSLLKRLQLEFNSSALPWRPGRGGEGARLINEIVLAEETDEDGQRGFASHFETYRAAMREARADTQAIDQVVADVVSGVPMEQAMSRVCVPDALRAFVCATMETAQHAPVHMVAASFLFGREAVLPALFAELLEQLTKNAPSLRRLHFYFARHIELDGDDHGPKALRLLESLCGDDALKWQEAQNAAYQSLTLRAALWRAIADEVQQA